jgi:hypothetical protein
VCVADAQYLGAGCLVRQWLVGTCGWQNCSARAQVYSCVPSTGSDTVTTCGDEDVIHARRMGASVCLYSRYICRHPYSRAE